MNDHPTWLPDSRRLLQLLNSLPRTNDTLAWIAQFKRVLMRLLEGVDHVSVLINGTISLSIKEQDWGRFFAESGPLRGEFPNAYISSDAIIFTADVLPSYPRANQMSPVASVIYDNLKRETPEISDFRDPIAFDYYTHEGRFLGIVFLWRNRSKPPVPQYTVELMENLHEFMMFAFEDAVARAELQRPLFRGIFAAMARLVETIGLLDHEARVLGYLLLGLAYDQIADRMNISVNTVRKYITSIYRKADVHSLGELFATYFMPWSE